MPSTAIRSYLNGAGASVSSKTTRRRLADQDSVPCHTVKESKDWCRSKIIQLLFWLRNSPDLNPIENLWRTVGKLLSDNKNAENSLADVHDRWRYVSRSIGCPVHCLARSPDLTNLDYFSWSQVTGVQNPVNRAETLWLASQQLLRKSGIRPWNVREVSIASLTPLTGNYRRFHLQCYGERRIWTTEWNDIVFTDESRFCLQHHDSRIRVWRHRSERLLNCCVMHHHTGSAPGITVWGGVGFYCRTPLVRIAGTLNSQHYISEVLELIVLQYN
ncbi:transposable element Tcb1 transposase [Trichonephila clavipes]|nr:transposable element Tcb1 transposase [Trichonephila clavipes]